MDYDKQRKRALRLFKGKKYAELRQAVRDGECFDVLLPLAEKAGAIEHWDKFIDEWKYYAGEDWDDITDEMRREAFPKLKEREWVRRAYYDWSGISALYKNK